ncbi:MAG: cytochrome c [Saprospiraceae bacterium]|jgi:mono/diheme cytochrome c family protein|nr:cytochrome c [Saprospiraceae bacterium]
MKRLQIVVLSALVGGVFACGGGEPSQESSTSGDAPKSMVSEEPAATNDGTGVGEIKNVELANPLDQAMVKEGEGIYDMKCSACHKITDERVVGPGWASITKRRKPEWIMNMITNVDVMLAEDPEAQKLLEECLTRMPNQNVSVTEARSILEFMRSNDGEK